MFKHIFAVPGVTRTWWTLTLGSPLSFSQNHCPQFFVWTYGMNSWPSSAYILILQMGSLGLWTTEWVLSGPCKAFFKIRLILQHYVRGRQICRRNLKPHQIGDERYIFRYPKYSWRRYWRFPFACWICSGVPGKEDGSCFYTLGPPLTLAHAENE